MKSQVTKTHVPPLFRATHGKNGVPLLHAMPESLPEEVLCDDVEISEGDMADYMRSLTLEAAAELLQKQGRKV